MAWEARWLMRDAARILQDENYERWRLPHLRDWINAGMREIANVKPDAKTETRTLSLVSGSRQTFAASLRHFIRITRNMTSAAATAEGREAVEMVSRAAMDAEDRQWHNPTVFTPTKRVWNAVYDPDDPRAFYVWPPNDGTGRVEGIFGVLPDNVPVGDPAHREAGYASDLDIDDIYVNALLDYVLYRAFQQDMQFAGYAARAQSHYAAFANALGMKIQNEIAMSPGTQ